MRTIITLLAVCFSILTFAQSQISITSNGNFLRVFIDGNLQNQSPKTFLKVINVPQGQHAIRVEYSSNNQLSSSQNLFLLGNKKYTFQLQSVNGFPQLVLTEMGFATSISANGVNVVNFSSNTYNNAGNTLNPNCTCGNCYGNTLGCNPNVNGGSIHIDMSGGGFTTTTNNGCVCPSNPIPGHNYHCSMHPYYNSNTTTYNTGNGCVCPSNPLAGHNYHCSVHPFHGTNTTTHSGVHPQMLTYNGQVGCYKNRISRNELLTEMRKESFDDKKVGVAKMALAHNSISVEDLKAALELLSFDDGKLSLAKYAYDHVIDIANFYKVGSSFTFSSNKEELMQFVQSK